MSVHGNTFDCFSHFFSEENFFETVEGQFLSRYKIQVQSFLEVDLRTG